MEVTSTSATTVSVALIDDATGGPVEAISVDVARLFLTGVVH